MSITMQEVLTRLDTDEPDYAALATLGPEVVPHLTALVRSEDPGIASKAAYLASMIDADDSMDVVAAAAASPHETVRVAAAAGLRNLAPARAAAAADRLLDDADVGVRRQALRAVADLGMSGLEPKVRRIANNDPEQGLRQMARQGLQKITAARGESAEAGRPAAAKAAKRGAKAAKRGAAKSAKGGAKSAKSGAAKSAKGGATKSTKGGGAKSARGGARRSSKAGKK